MGKGNKLMKGIVISAIILAVILIAIVVFYITRPVELTGRDVNGTPAPMKYQFEVEEGDSEMIKEDQPYVEHQVLTVADSKREARKIAQAVGGELISYDNQVAIIQIGITVEEMMQQLEEDPSLPKVYPNYQNYTN